MRLDPRVSTIENYLDLNFASAQIHSAPAAVAGEGNAHTFTIKDDDRLHVLAVCRDFLESYRGSVWQYLAEHDVAATLRNAGAERLVVTPEGLRRNCTGGPASQVAPTSIPPAPKPASAGRPTPLTASDKRDFLDCLARYDNVSWAAEQVGKTRACLYAHRKRDRAFAAAWDAITARSTGRYNRVSMARGYRIVDIRSGAVRSKRRSSTPESAPLDPINPTDPNERQAYRERY